MSELIYEGKAKKVYSTDDPDAYLIQFKDSLTAFNGKKKDTLLGKGTLNNKISAIFFRALEQEGIPTHFLRQVSDTETLVKKVKIIPLEVLVRNIVAGSLAKRLGLKEGTSLKEPGVEFTLKDDSLGDPFIERSLVIALNIIKKEEVEEITSLSLAINEILREILEQAEITLVDFKLEFGRDKNGKLLLADEISPDTCRFWDKGTGKKLDKDQFRQDLGELLPSYEEVFRRLEKISQPISLKNKGYQAEVQVMLKKTINDPQGQTVKEALLSLGFSEVKDVRMGKNILINLEATSRQKARERVENMCQLLLANPIIESFHLQAIEELKE